MTPIETTSTHTLGRSGIFIVLATAVLVVLALLGFRSTLNEHEVFAAEPARELLEGGSLVLQQFAGEYRTKKPPGQSWLIATSLYLTQSRSEYAARLPSALAATGLALLAGAIGARLLGRRGGIVAGLMTLTCFAVQVRARLAEADMVLAFFIALSFAGILLPLLRLRRTIGDADPVHHELPFKPARYGFLFWIALGAAFLIKGPIALLFVLPPIIVFWLIVRFRTSDRATLRLVEMIFLNPYAMVIGLAMILGWPISAYLAHPDVLAQWKHELFSRAAGAIRRDPLWAYLGFIPLGTLPWCLFCFAMLDRRAALKRSAEGLLALWLACGFILLSVAIAFKALHYCLPILFPVLLLSAAGFNRLLERFLARFADESRRRSMAVVSIASWFGIVSVAWLVNQYHFEPIDDARAGVKPFVQRIHTHVPADAPVYLVAVGEERAVWYIANRSIQTRKREDDSLEDQLARLPADGAFVLCPTSRIDDLRSKVRTLEVLEISSDYRGRADGLERRALIRVVSR